MSFRKFIATMQTLSVPLLLIASVGFTAVCRADDFIDSKEHRFKAVTIADGLAHPWGMAFLPGGDLLVTERTGTLRRISNGVLSAPLAGLPEIYASGQGGLLDVALHPDFASNKWVYLTYSAGGYFGASTELARGRLLGNRLADTEVLFVARPKSSGGQHFGSRIRFLRDGSLLMTLGDRGKRPEAQNTGSHTGSTIRLNDDGSVPKDNPFVGHPGVKPEIYTLGNRNVQGLTLHPQTGLPWAHEHGPKGGDEINVLHAGKNYGWPVITYGVNYGIGTRIGEGTHKVGMEQPLYYWDPSIAPSGMDFYTGDKFPNWQGDLFVGALAYRLLARLELDGERIISEERLLQNEFGRIRDVRNGPDGYLYLLTDDPDGRIIRLEPAP